MPTSVKICRDCGEEYRLDTLQCADCGGALEVRRLDEDGEAQEAPAAEQTEPEPADTRDHRVIFVTPRAADLVPLAEALRESGVPHRLAEQPAHADGGATRYALLVRDEAAADALRVLAPLLAPHEDPQDFDGIEARFEPESGYTRCPACGAEQPRGSLECAECGLGLGSEEPEG